MFFCFLMIFLRRIVLEYGVLVLTRGRRGAGFVVGVFRVGVGGRFVSFDL